MATTKRRTAQQIAADAQAAYRASLSKQLDKFDRFAADWSAKETRYGALARDAAANKTACEATCKDLLRQIAQIDAATAAFAGGADAPR